MVPGGLNKDEEPVGPGEVGAAPLPPSGLLQLLPRAHAFILLKPGLARWMEGVCNTQTLHAAEHPAGPT